MQKEIPNTNTGWRSKIAGLDALPGDVSTDFGEAWDKLQGRLAGRKSSNRIIWYYISAACVAFIIFCIAFYLDQPKPDSEKSIQNIPKTSSVHVYVQPVDVKTRSAVPKKRKSARPVKKLAIPALVQERAVQPDLIIKDTIDIASVIAPTLTRNSPPMKKLRVVHINELHPEGKEQIPQWANHKKRKPRDSKTKNLVRSFVNNSASDKLFEIGLSPSK